MIIQCSLVVVRGIAVLAAGFPVMAGLAQRLPVALVPEQFRITPVGHDVVDHRCGDIPSISLAFSTQRMAVKKSL